MKKKGSQPQITTDEHGLENTENNVKNNPKRKILRKDYELSSGIKCYQEDLTYKQDKQILSLLKNLNIESISDLSTMKISDLMGILFDENLLEKFLKIILLPTDKKEIPEEKLTEIKNSELEEIIEDFFILNPSVMKLLNNIKSLAGSEIMSSMLESSEQK